MVKPKKHLGQHFLKDKNIAEKIVKSLDAVGINKVYEIGPGTGILTQFLLAREFETFFIEIDQESVEFLLNKFPQIKDRIISQDFLTYRFEHSKDEQTAVVGNFPYNISSQILFKILENRESISEMVGMFQKEVADRIASKPGSKVYGILSVLVQAFYDVNYLFTVNESVFNPPPKVKSGVIKLKRKLNFKLPCNEDLFFKVVKAGFNQRRKILKNSLKSLTSGIDFTNELFLQRPEQLNVEHFVNLTSLIERKAD